MKTILKGGSTAAGMIEKVVTLRDLELFLIDAIAELETTGGSMEKMSWQYEEGVLINGRQAKFIVHLSHVTEVVLSLLAEIDAVGSPALGTVEELRVAVTRVK